MQKLLRISPSGPIICTSVPNPPWGISTKKKKQFFFNFSSVSQFSAAMPAMAVKPFTGGGIMTRNTTTSLSKTARFVSAASSNCAICRCSLDNGASSPVRAWVVFKEAKSVVNRSAWFHTKIEPGFSVVSASEQSSSSLPTSSTPDSGFQVVSAAEVGSSSSTDSGFQEVSAAEVGSSSSPDSGFQEVFAAEVGSSSSTDSGFQEVSAAEESSSSLTTDSEEKTSRVQRRQRSSSIGGGGGGEGGGASPVLGNPDLLTIPGVGPRNLRKLVDKGIGEVADLKQLYKDKFFGKSSQTMVEYLQSSVGIIHKNHAKSITSFIKESVDEELKEDNPNSDVRPSQNKRLTFCVEGNISVGKTTFLQRIANETLELRDLVEVVPEPISKWQDVGPDHFNILDAFYAEPERYAYTFQNYVFVTRVMQERESSGGIKPLRLMERSVFSDRMVFVRAVHEANWMNEMEISIYDSWFDPVVSSLPGLIPDGFIYLRASPDTCHKRMMHRRRTEEGGVSLDYLRGLHEKHESWMFPSQSGNHGVLSFSQLPFHMDTSLHPEIRDRVFYLEGEHMHSSIQKVPALVLDCEPNIDFSKDIEAKQQYARQVAEFFEFVKKKKEVPLPNVGDQMKNPNPHLLMPTHKGLWVPPGGKPFPDPSLSSLDFRRAMSTFLSG